MFCFAIDNKLQSNMLTPTSSWTTGGLGGKRNLATLELGIVHVFLLDVSRRVLDNYLAMNHPEKDIVSCVLATIKTTPNVYHTEHNKLHNNSAGDISTIYYAIHAHHVVFRERVYLSF